MTKNLVHIDIVALQDVSISITLPLEAAFAAGSVLVGTSGAGRREKERWERRGEVLLPLRYSRDQREGEIQLLKRGQGTVSSFLKLQTSGSIVQEKYANSAINMRPIRVITIRMIRLTHSLGAFL